MDHYLRPGQRSSKREHPGIHEGVIASCRVVLHSTAKHFVLADFVRGLFRSFKSSTQEQASPARHRLLIRHHEAEQGLGTTFCISRSVTRYCRSLRRTNEMHAKGDLLGRAVVFWPAPEEPMDWTMLEVAVVHDELELIYSPGEPGPTQPPSSNLKRCIALRLRHDRVPRSTTSRGEY